jgi:hypothetical protein
MNTKETFLKEFIKIITDNKIKIFLIEYFITNYSKKNQIYILKEEDDFFYINDEYKNQLKSFNKNFFDPYKRKNKFKLEYENDIIITTIGQMNFFKWAIVNNIMKYINEHYDEILLDYNMNSKNSKKSE